MEQTTQQTTAAAEPVPAPDNNDFGSNFGDLLDKAFSSDPQPPEAPAAETPEPKTEPEKTEEPATKTEEPTSSATEDDEAPKNMSPKAAEKWAVLKAKTKAAEERAAELERRIAESETKGQTNVKAEQELAALNKKLSDYETKFKEQENEIAVSRVEATEEYKQVVVAPMQQLVSQIEGMAKKYDVSLDTLLRAVVAGPDDNSLEEAVGSFSQRDQTRIFNVQEQYHDIQKRRESIRGNAQEAMRIVEERRTQQQQQQLAEENKVWERALDEGWEELKASTPLFAEMEKIPERKAQADEIRNYIRSGQVINMAPKEKARLLYQGAAAPMLEAIAREFFNENKQLKEKLDAMKAASPSPSAGSAASEDNATYDDYDFETIIEKKLRA
jgi:hypothetical protein